MKELNFDKSPDGLIPAIIQNKETLEVLMLGFMNREALEQTIKIKKVTFYSRTKKRLWTKGETSGNYLHMEEIIPDCDNDTLLIFAKPIGPTCHTGDSNCFGTKNNGSVQFLNYLENVIEDRFKNPSENSYTTKLFKKGINKIAQKVGEEAVELVIEAKDNNDNLFLNEAADLMFHYLVLLKAKNKKLTDVIKVLENRHKIN